jgi:multiple antibiotic resistance protein
MLLPDFFFTLSAIFFVVDPIGLVPLFIAMTDGDGSDKVRSTCLRACLFGAAILAFFALFGRLLFEAFGVSLAGFRVAGGLLLLMTALDMLRARTSETKTSGPEAEEGVAKEDIALVPLALPLLSGPGAIATAMVLSSKGPGWVPPARVLLSIGLTFVATYFILRSAQAARRVMGASGLALVQRVMGLLLAAVAVQFIADGAKDLFRG